MPSRLRLLLDRARTSYFVIPSAACVVGFGLAVLTLYLDHEGLAFEVPIPVEEMEDARSLLTTIASSSIAVAATVFSITIVVLSLASSQFGPRLLRNFLKNRSSQLVLGLFAGTHVYCLVALRTVGSSWDIPQLTCLVALALAIVDTGALVYFIHHTAAWVQVDRVIDVVGDGLRCELQRLSEEPRHYAEAGRWRETLGQPSLLVRAARSGYVQTHDDGRLAELAERRGVTFERRVAVGDFVLEGRPVLAVWGELEERDIARVRDGIGLGDARSDLQDPFHLLDQLIELALRSLSPGINDPMTARSCLDRIENALAVALARPVPVPTSEDPGGGRNREGRPHLIAEPPDLAALCERAFGEIRRAGADQWLIVRRLAEVLEALIDVARDPRVEQALEAELAQLPREPLAEWSADSPGGDRAL